ncbi:DNA polymerase I [Pseudomonas phage PPPL-1]|uniref:DNA polymerase n=1 Tax=Pseudomonas phage PPPL-1 TaxID=1755692 RepID=A0A0S2MVT0_9CAUD|nr:DNA polymerase I [Pseudomonas phage PPPL-1]ALO79986.1 DNA polymerase [Pseudomonas phage PPPL-1]
MLISDIETNGLLETVDRFHCATIQDYFTGQYVRYNEATFGDYIKALEEEAAKPDGLIVGHNFIKYDIPALDKLKRQYFGKRLNIPRKKVLDTLVMTRLVYSNIRDRDAGLLRSGILPGKMFGSHALEAWGYRLGEMKGEYKTDFIRMCDDQGIPYTPGLEWAECSQAMEDYCEQDVRVTSKLLRKILGDGHYFVDGQAIEAVRMEHSAAWTLAQMERNGFPFSIERAERLHAELAGTRQDLLVELIETFGSWWASKGGTEQFKHPVTGQPLEQYPRVKYPKVGDVFTKAGKLDKRETMSGAPYTPIEQITFNPGSRAHLVKVLKDAGWVPILFTDNGSPVVDDEALGHVRVSDPKKQAAIELIRKYLMIQKRLGMLAEGDNAWLKMVKDDGAVHGSINPNGAGTGRATHAYPNMGQVPSASSPYGPECRDLFGAIHAAHRPGWENVRQVGTDAAGLELRCLGHYGAPFDDGKYAETVLNGDIHWVNGRAAGIVKFEIRDKHNEEHEVQRGIAKTFIYAFLYGAGDELVGAFVGGGKKEGKALKKAFMENTPAISGLQGAIAGQLITEQKWNQATKRFDIKWKRRWLKGLDGRQIHVRSPHSALNFLLQSAGAIVCKKWVVEVERVLMEEHGLYHGWYDDEGNPGDFCFMAWVHDELQIAARTPEIAEIVAKVSQDAIRSVGESFNFRCQLDTDFKIGDTWRDCH